MKTMERMFSEFIGEDAHFVSGILMPATPEREHQGHKFKATTARLKMSFSVNGKEHRVVMERFPDPIHEMMKDHPL